MNTLIAVAGLGILVLVLEIFGARKIIVPVTVLCLLALLGLTIGSLQAPSQSFYNNMIMEDLYSKGFSCLFICLTIFLITLSSDFYKQEMIRLSDYTSVKLFLLFGGLAMVSFGNLAAYFMGIEILSISLYVLAASQPKEVKSNEAGMKYFLMGAFASGFLLFGIALIYGASGSFDIATIHEKVMTGKIASWFYIGITLVSVAMLFKVAAAPFHFWAPDVYEGAPTLTTALMSTLAKVVAFGGFFRLMAGMLGDFSGTLAMAILVISILSMTIGNVMALRQNNVKRMLAFSGISHAGFMLMTLLTINNGFANLLYYAAAYSLAGMAAFAVILFVTSGKGGEDIRLFNGLGKNHPLMAAVLTAALLSMAGIPVFAGFFAKVFLFNEILDRGYILLVIFAVVNSIISVGYYFRLILAMYSREPEEKQAPSVVYTSVAVLAICLNLLLGIYPDLIMGWI